MMSAIRAEFRKLFTVRSTYALAALSGLIVIFYAGFIEGWKAGDTVHNPFKLASEVTGAVGAVSIFAAIVAILLMAHEYRYNTIMFTLTFSNSRSKVLIAKIIAVSVFAIGFTTLVAVLSPLCTWAGLSMHGLHLAPQTLFYKDLIWRSLFFGWSYAMLGLLVITLVRNQIGAIVGLFIAPATIEPLLGLLMKEKSVYLPFSAHQAVLDATPRLSYSHATMVFMAYLIIGWLVAWFLFLRRDAN